MDDHFKEKNPVETVAFIRNILKETGIETEDQFPDYDGDGTCSLRTVIKGTSVGQNGKGVTREYALASAYAEFMERLQNDYLFQFNYTEETNRYLGFYNFIDEKIISPREFVGQKNDFLTNFLQSAHLSGLTEEEQSRQIEENYRQSCLRYRINGLLAYPYYSVRQDKLCYIPTDMCTGTYLSSGMCAGNTMEEAMVQGISEIWERHIHKLVLREGTPLPDIPDPYIRENYRYVWELLERFRAHPDYTVFMKDASLGGVFPAAMLIITDRKNHSYGVRFGAHIDLGVAMERTITEALQGKKMREFTLCCKPDCTDREVARYYNVFNSLKVGCSNYFMRIFHGESRYHFCEPVKYKSNKEALDIYCNRILEQGYDLMMRDVSYLGFPSYQLIIPGLSEVFPADLQMARLNNTVQYVSEKMKDLGRLDHKDLDYIVRVIDSKGSCIIEGELPAFYRTPLNLTLPFTDQPDAVLVLGALIRYSQGNFEEALRRLDQYIQKMRISGLMAEEYLLCAREYMAARISQAPTEKAGGLLSCFFSRDVAEKVSRDFRDETKTLSLIYPQLSCPQCGSRQTACSCGEIEKIKRTLKEKQKEHPLNQMKFRHSMPFTWKRDVLPHSGASQAPAQTEPSS